MNKGEELVFFHDQEFSQMAEFAPSLFSGEENPLFKELSNIAKESGYALKPVVVDIQQEDFINTFRQKLPKPGNKVVITSFLYNVPELQDLLSECQTAVVGAAMDIPVDRLRIIGNGFNLLSDEGRLLAVTGKKIYFIALKSDFQQRILQAFKDGAGSNVVVYEAGLNDKNIYVPATEDYVVASYGQFFKSFAAPKIRSGIIRVINYPGSPEYADPYMKKRVESFICYDFIGSFKSAILELSSRNNEKKSFYSFDLVRR